MSVLVVQNNTGSAIEVMVRLEGDLSKQISEIQLADKVFSGDIDHNAFTELISISFIDSLTYRFQLPPQNAAMLLPRAMGGIPAIDYVEIIKNGQSERIVINKTTLEFQRSSFMLSSWILNVD